MIKVIKDRNEWSACLARFIDIDIYYTFDYLHAFQIHGDGEPLLIYFEDDSIKAVNAVMKRRLDVVGYEAYSDFATPYGYGGWHIEGNLNSSSLAKLNAEYTYMCKSTKVVSEFVRFHPLLDNAHTVDEIYDVVDLGSTVSMDLTNVDVINQNLTSKNRNVIRKAIKSGVTIETSRDKAAFDAFIEIYNDTMRRDNAEKYYYFEKAFYDSIRNDLGARAEVYCAKIGDEMIGGAIILNCGQRIHYHLSGAKREYMTLAPMNLLLYRVACDYAERGFKTFHLGGGVSSDSDSGLYRFKASFNRNSNNRFSIGKKIFDEDAYRVLVEQKKNKINPDSHFFPLYRSVCDD